MLIVPPSCVSVSPGYRLFDNSNEGFRNWEFMTVHCWGERAEGSWTLEVFDSPSQLRNPEVLGKFVFVVLARGGGDTAFIFSHPAAFLPPR